MYNSKFSVVKLTHLVKNSLPKPVERLGARKITSRKGLIFRPLNSKKIIENRTCDLSDLLVLVLLSDR